MVQSSPPIASDGWTDARTDGQHYQVPTGYAGGQIHSNTLCTTPVCDVYKIEYNGITAKNKQEASHPDGSAVYRAC